MSKQLSVPFSPRYRLYEKLGQQDNAAAAYTDFVNDEFRNSERAELSNAYKFLTQYFINQNDLDQANHYAQKCLQYDETKEEAKAFLRSIAHKRMTVEGNSMIVEDMNETNPIGVIDNPAVTPASQLSPINLSFNPHQ